MSCPYATAPIDINPSRVTGNCDYKCSYSFFYNNSSCITTNRGDYLSLSYDKSSSPPVLYNSIGYDVQEIRIYIPSLHAYSGQKASGEMIIIHRSNVSANPLLVCIPIKSNNTSTVSALLFQTLINTVGDSAPSEGNSTTVNIPRFNLNLLVPKKPFYSYTATEPFQPCSSGNVDYVVFDSLTASIDMMPQSLKKLQSIIRNNPYNIKSGPSLFFNEKGPSSGGAAGNDIYIDCKPVSESEDTVQTVSDLADPTYENWLDSPLVKVILGALVFIIILYVTKSLLGMFSPTISGGSTDTGTSSNTNTNK